MEDVVALRFRRFSWNLTKAEEFRIFEVAMFVGLISDSHGVWSPEFQEFLEPCDVVWHAGDWGADVEFTKQISDWKPVVGVYGNCDGHHSTKRSQSDFLGELIKKHVFKIILGCLVSLVLIYLCIRNIDFKQSVSLLKNADLSLIALGVIIYAASYLVRGFRWDYILMPLKKMKMFQSFFYLVFGFFMNNILPLRLGEFVRAIVAGKKLEISRSGVFATIVVERLMDIIIFIISFFLIAMFVPNIPAWLQKSFIACAIIFGLMFIVLFFMSKDEDKFLKLLSKFHLPSKINEIIKSLFIKFASGLKFFQNKKLFFIVFITSIIVWIIEAYAYKTLFAAFGLNVTVIQCLFVIVTTGIATMLPTAPGFIGAIESVGMVTLGIFGVEDTMAFTAMAATHFVEMMAVYALGITGMIKERISFSDLFSFALKEHPETEEQDGK